MKGKVLWIGYSEEYDDWKVLEDEDSLWLHSEYTFQRMVCFPIED